MNAFSKLLATLGLSAVVALCPCCSTASRAEPPGAVASTKTVSLTVEGMTCASCSVAVRMALKKLDGVKEAKVSVEDGRAVVDYEPTRVTPQQMVETVDRLGYRASLPKGP